MGKNLIQQARGKGGPTYRAPSFRFVAKAKHYKFNQTSTGIVTDIVTCQAHTAPLIEITFENKDKHFTLAPEGVRVGDKIESGENVPINTGNTLKLKNMPEGTSVYNIESQPGDGGKFVRTSGSFAKIVGKFEDKIVLLLPSNRTKDFRPDCRASIGIIAGSGRLEKPFLKAGTRHYNRKAKNKLYPSVSGTSMNSVDHPFGGSSSGSKGRPTQSARNSPPGRKVGKIAPRRTGLRKK
jgi:large subunit ribosomal protein L2